MPIQVEKNELNLIKTILKKYLPQAHFLVFGSRYTGQAKKYSDLDIAIDNGSPVALNILSMLEEEFAESDLSFKIDLVDFQRITIEFQQLIKKQHEKLC